MTTRTEERLLLALKDIRAHASNARNLIDCLEATLRIEELAGAAVRLIRDARAERAATSQEAP